MEYIFEILLFTGKALVVFLCLAGLLGALGQARQKLKREDGELLEVECINDKISHNKEAILCLAEDKKSHKKHLKEQKKKSKKPSPGSKKRVFVLEFEGDMKASQVEQLRNEVSAVVGVARPDKDEVVLKLESPGGMVHAYGLAAAQVARLREKSICVTVCVDKIAASGGYMMACLGNKILASPFAVVGSIGVVAQVPNLHQVLKKHGVEYKEVTAGEYKRTVSLFGEITPKGMEHFESRIQDTHELFKDFVKKYRPGVDIKNVGTGDYWYGLRAKKLGLVDELKTSDAYILDLVSDSKVYQIKTHHKKSLSEKLAESLSSKVQKVIEGASNRILGA